MHRSTRHTFSAIAFLNSHFQYGSEFWLNFFYVFFYFRGFLTLVFFFFIYAQCNTFSFGNYFFSFPQNQKSKEKNNYFYFASAVWYVCVCAFTTWILFIALQKSFPISTEIYLITNWIIRKHLKFSSFHLNAQLYRLLGAGAPHVCSIFWSFYIWMCKKSPP